jgi:hypothetical protein
MKRLLIGLGVAAVAMTPSAALANPPEHFPGKPQQAFDACTAVVERQSAIGVTAGGGPKVGFLAPTNCDFFFFLIGAIGTDSD